MNILQLIFFMFVIFHMFQWLMMFIIMLGCVLNDDNDLEKRDITDSILGIWLYRKVWLKYKELDK